MTATPQPLVRVAGEADVPAVLALVRAVLAEYGLTFGEGSETDAQLAGLPASYDAAGGRFWVAALDGALVGTCGVFPVAPGSFELRKMYVSPAARGRGLGRRLLDAAIAYARERGAREIVLDTIREMTRAQGLYEANGFVRDDAQIRGARCNRGYRLDLQRPPK